MKKVFSVALLSMILVQLTYADPDKTIFCPDPKVVKITLTEQWHYILSAYNKDGKYFVSEPQTYDENNGPAPVLNLVSSSYDTIEKRLTCVYSAYHKYGSRPALINVGDY